MKRNKITTTLSVLVLLMLVCFGCSTKEEMGKVVIDPLMKDLGEIRSDRKVSISFHIVNNTNEQRKITSQAKSCGCTTLKMASKKLKAHERVRVQLEFNPERETGDFQKSAFFRLDNGEVLIFKFTGSVKK